MPCESMENSMEDKSQQVACSLTLERSGGMLLEMGCTATARPARTQDMIWRSSDTNAWDKVTMLSCPIASSARSCREKAQMILHAPSKANR